MTKERRGSTRRSRLIRLVAATLCAGALTLGGAGAVAAQDATPSQPGDDVDLLNVDGEQVGTANFTESSDAVVISVTITNLPPGQHGIHIHETGVCDPSGDEPFSSAGGHFNPTGASHGPGPQLSATPGAATPAPGEAHAGDLGNFEVEEDGTATVVITTNRVTLGEGETSLADADGSALVVHEGADDLMTDPSGESGARIACGVIFDASGGTTAATPAS